MRKDKHITPQKKNKLLSVTPVWMKGGMTFYEVAKQCNVEWHTAKKYMLIFSEQIKQKETEIMNKIITPVPVEEKITTWQRIKKEILKYIITEPRKT